MNRISIHGLAIFAALAFASPGNAKSDDEALLLGCRFDAAPSSQSVSSDDSTEFYLLYRDGIEVLDYGSLLDGTKLKHWKKTGTSEGELWTFSESNVEPTGIILIVLPKATLLESGAEARRASLGAYRGSGPLGGTCIVERGTRAVSVFAALRSGNDNK